MEDGTGHAEKMLGLDGVRILEVEERPGELVVTAETTKRVGYCPSCRKRAKQAVANWPGRCMSMLWSGWRFMVVPLLKLQNTSE